MKKYSLLLVMFFVVAASFAKPPVNEKVLKVFAEVFPTVKNASWFEGEKFYEVYFDKDGVKSRLRYDFDGHLLSTIRYYDGENLPPFLKARIAKKYPEKTVYGVTENNTDHELNFHIILEDENTWLHVQSNAYGHMSVTDKFKKAEQ